MSLPPPPEPATGSEPSAPSSLPPWQPPTQQGAPAYAETPVPAPQHHVHLPFISALPKYRHSRRTLAGILCLVGFLVLAAAILTPWYAITEDFGNGTTVTTQYFNPGASGFTSCTGQNCPSFNNAPFSYFGNSLSAVGNLYLTLEAALIVTLIVGILGTLVVFAASMGYLQRRSMLRTGMFLVLLAAILSLVISVGAAAAQPAAFNIDTSGHLPSQSPANSYIGSCSGSSTAGQGFCSPNESSGWGPSVGWFLGLAAFVLFLLGFLFVFSTRRDPVTRSEIEQSAPGTFSFSGGAPPPLLSQPIVCRRCGTPNPAGVAKCGRCGQKPT